MRRSTAQVESGRRRACDSRSGPSSAAEYALLRAGDTLIGVDGRALGSLNDLEQVLEGGGQLLLRLRFIRDDRDKVRAVALRLGVLRVTAA